MGPQGNDGVVWVPDEEDGLAVAKGQVRRPVGACTYEYSKIFGPLPFVIICFCFSVWTSYVCAPVPEAGGLPPPVPAGHLAALHRQPGPVLTSRTLPTLVLAHAQLPVVRLLE